MFLFPTLNILERLSNLACCTSFIKLSGKMTESSLMDSNGFNVLRMPPETYLHIIERSLNTINVLQTHFNFLRCKMSQ